MMPSTNQPLPIPTSHRGTDFSGAPSMFAPMSLTPSGPAATQAAPPAPASPQFISATAQAMHSSGPGVSYGSGASDHPAGLRSQSSRSKVRSRDRQSGSHRSNSASISATPPAGGRRMGPQETMDWNDIITRLNDRVAALENHNRAHGQRTAEIFHNFSIIDAKFDTLLIPLAEDIPLYKSYVESRFNNVTSIASDKFSTHDAHFERINSSFDVAGSNFTTADNRIRTIEDAMNRMYESIQLLQSQLVSGGTPQQFSMGTPMVQQRPDGHSRDDMPTAGRPMAPGPKGFQPMPNMGAPEASSYPTHLPGPSLPGNMPRYDYPQAGARQSQGPDHQFQAPPTGMPASFGGHQ